MDPLLQRVESPASSRLRETERELTPHTPSTSSIQSRRGKYCIRMRARTDECVDLRIHRGTLSDCPFLAPMSFGAFGGLG